MFTILLQCSTQYCVIIHNCMLLLSMIILFPLTRELRALHGAWATPRSSSILEKTERSSARSICRGLVPRIFTPFRCNGAARLFGICPPTETMLPEQPCRGEDRRKENRTAGRIKKGEWEDRGEILCQDLDLLPEAYKPRLTVWNLWPVAIILATDHTVKICDKPTENSWSWSSHRFSYHQGQCVYVCVWVSVCSPFNNNMQPLSCLANPEGMLFPW